jgi:radical SAM superfamily enzyme YgiQ (UPF0313 family)
LRDTAGLTLEHLYATVHRSFLFPGGKDSALIPLSRIDWKTANMTAEIEEGESLPMRIHLINPSDLSFGVGVITPRWLFVLAAATPSEFGVPNITDEALEQIDPTQIQEGDVVGIGIHTTNALRGYEVGRIARKRGAYVVFGGIHAGLFPEEACELGGAHAVVKGDGDLIWPKVLSDCSNGGPRQFYDGGHVEPGQFLQARWDLMPRDRYMWASVQTVRGCPKHCSFCSVWRTDGQRPRQRAVDAVIEEIVTLRRSGFRFIALADDNFYPVTLRDIEVADRRTDKTRRDSLKAMRDERFELMERMSELPEDMVFFTQLTMEAAEDPEFLDAMRKANIKGALVGIESVTPEGLKSIYKDFNLAGNELVKRLQVFRDHEVFVLGSFIFGLPSDRQETFQLTAQLAQEGDVTFAQFVMLAPFPGTIDFKKWEDQVRNEGIDVDGIPVSRYWLIPQSKRPKVYISHPTMSADEIREGTQTVWDHFYRAKSIWKRSGMVPSVRRRLKARLAFLLISKLYRQMYANTGISTDSARTKRSTKWARWIAKPCRRLFQAAPMPDLQVPRG